MSKRTLMALASVCFIIGLSGCGGKSETDASTSDKTDSTGTPAASPNKPGRGEMKPAAGPDMQVNPGAKEPAFGTKTK